MAEDDGQRAYAADAEASSQAASKQDSEHVEAQPNGAAAEPAKPLLQKYNEQWQTVTKTPDDFNTWTALLATADKLGEAQPLLDAFEAFLAEYPLCYGYWKKYADARRRHAGGSREEAVSVLERGVAAVPYSVELWAHYAALMHSEGASVEDVRSIYERALAYVASDWNAHTLWDKYLAWEAGNGSSQAVAALHRRVLSCPIKELDRLYAGCKDYARVRTPGELVSAAQLEQLRVAAEARRASKAAAAAGGDADVAMSEAAATAAAAPAEAPRGLEEQGSVGGERAPGDDDVSAGPSEDDVLRAEWLQQCEQQYQATKAEQQLRQPFESAIKRPYYHFKPLDPAQLTNWEHYLAWSESQREAGATVALFERCLVPCANYPEFWARYVRFLLASGDSGAAAAALQRGAFVHCKRRPQMQLFAARFLEQQGDVAGARLRLQLVLEQLAPGLLEAILAAANLERRQGDMPAARQVYKSALQTERERPGSARREGCATYAFLALQYAHFLRQVAQDEAAARSVLDAALSHAPGCLALWEGALWLEEAAGGEGMAQRVMALYQRALAGSAADEPAAAAAGALTDAEQRELSARSVQFADLYCDAAEAAAAEAAHARRYMLPPPPSAAQAAAAAEAQSRKRALAEASATGGADSGSDQHGAKQARVEGAAAAATALPLPPATTPPLAGADAAAAAAAAAYYGQPGYHHYHHDAAGYYGAYGAGGYGAGYGYGY